MKSFFSFLIILVLFSAGLFAAQESDFSIYNNTGTFLIDKGGNSHNINGGAAFSIQDEQWSFSAGGLLGELPGKIAFSNRGFGFKLNDISYCSGSAAFSYNFTDSFSAGLTLSTAAAQTDTSDLYLLFGSLSFPSCGGASLNLFFPYDLFLSTRYYGADYDFLNEQDNSIGGGKLHLLDINAGKDWLFHGQNDSTFHKLNTSAGFLYAYINGDITVTTNEQNQVFLPFSYAFGNWDLCAEFITLNADYNFHRGGFDLFVDTALYMNVYSYVRYFFKGTYKKNIFYDGSIIRSEDTFNFSHADSILTLDAKLAYSPDMSNSMQLGFSLDKQLVIPIISKASQQEFLYKAAKKKAFSKEQIKRYAKLALLSGWSVGINICF